LDYYNLSVFEWVSSNLGAQGTVAAGGRYDPLVKELSGKDNYAIGFAIGLERILLELEALNIVPNRVFPDVFIATVGSDTQALAFKIAGILRGEGLSVVQNFGVNSFKSQLKKDDVLKCKFTVIIGETEVSNNQVMVKLMDRQTQESVAIENLVDFLRKI
jgi:histidyl-tRNA synthetase